MSLKLITAALTDPISLEEAKAHLREDSSDFDDQITAFIKAAVAYCEGPRGFLGRVLIDQTWQLTLDSFPGHHHRHGSWHHAHHEIKIPMPPLIGILSIKYDDTAGVEQTMTADQYTVDTNSEPGWVMPVGSWPATFSGINAVRIQFRAGYLDQNQSPPVANVPEGIKQAIKMLIGSFYLNRENEIVGDTSASLPFAVDVLLRQHRLQLGMA